MLLHLNGYTIGSPIMRYVLNPFFFYYSHKISYFYCAQNLKIRKLKFIRSYVVGHDLYANSIRVYEQKHKNLTMVLVRPKHVMW
jgi:hypothetical protein